MEPYDIYIWPSYIVTAVVLFALAVISWRGKKKDERNLRKLERQMRELAGKQGS